MKIRQAIETVDRLMPNQYENPDKVRWLSELDGIVYRDIICTHEHETAPEPFAGYGEDVDLETELLIPWPYDEIYRWYLGMKICDANGETTKYSNEAAKYNSYYQGYFNAYNQAYMPKQYATHFKL